MLTLETTYSLSWSTLVVKHDRSQLSTIVSLDMIEFHDLGQANNRASWCDLLSYRIKFPGWVKRVTVASIVRPEDQRSQ